MMETLPPAAAPRPTKPERDERRRAEIVEAGRRCVLRHGFHASPMAEIAREAGMSVGQVYRYFPGKDALVRAIVDDIIRRRLARMIENPQTPLTPERLATRAVEFDARHADDATLMLEVTAEATRNPEIAAVLREADRRSQQEAIRKALRRHPELTQDQAAALVEVAAVLIEGTLYRRMTELQAGTGALRDVFRRVLEALEAPLAAGGGGTPRTGA